MKLKSIVLSLLATLPLAIACQEEQPELADNISLKSEILNFDYKSTSQQIVFDSNCDWTATVDQDWVKLSHTSGKHNTRSITVTVEENPSEEAREAVVTISSVSSDANTKVTISQRGVSKAYDGHIRSVEHFMEFLALAPDMVDSDVAELEVDLDLGGASISPILTFAGELRGNGHSISNFTIKSTVENAGLILVNNGKISNLLVGTKDGKKWDGSTTISFADGVTGRAAGLIATNAGTVDGVKNFASVDFNATTDANDGAVGGVVGAVAAPTSVIVNCENHGTVTFSGVIGGRACMGGVLGFNAQENAVIENCTNYATIAKTNTNQKEFAFGGVLGRANKKMIIKSCTNLGSVTYDCTDKPGSYIHIGGVMGAAYYGCELTNCINKGDVTSNINQVNRMAGILGTGNTGVTITGCINEGTLTINQGENTNWQTVGGIVGLEEKATAAVPAKITNSSNKGNIKLILNNTTTHANKVSAAGIIGRPVSVCILEGNTNEGEIYISNTGASPAYAGGITGFYSNGSAGVTSSGNSNSGTIKVEAQDGAAGGILGYSTVASSLKEDSNTGTIICPNAAASGSIAGSTVGTINSCAVGGTVNGTAVTAGNYATLIQGSSSKANVVSCYLFGASGPASYITANPLSVEISFTGGEADITVDSNCEWTATSSAEWLTVSAAEGNADVKTLKLTATDNAVKEIRTATVTIVCKTDAEVKAVINVSQDAYTDGLPGNKITSVADFKKFATLAPEAAAEDVYTLESDLTISAEDFTQIESFAGTLDAKNHTITVNVSTSEIASLALFNTVTGTIKNLKIAGSITSTYSGTASHGIAGLVYVLNGGHIENCTNSAAITLNSSSASSTGYLSGLVAQLRLDGASVNNCHNTGKLTLTNSSPTLLGGVVACVFTNADKPTFNITSCTNSADILVNHTANNWNYFGGIIGKIGDSKTPITMFTISDCEFSGKMTIEKAAKVRGGGIIGSCGVTENYSIKNCKMTGTIESTSTESVDRLYAGIGPGFSEAGAIGTVSNCIFDGTINILGGNIFAAGIYGGNGSASVVVDNCKTTSKSKIGGYTAVKSIGLIAARPNTAGFTVRNCKVAGSIVDKDGNTVIVSADNIADWMFKGTGTSVEVKIENCGFNAE